MATRLVKKVRYGDGRVVDVDPNMQRLVGILRSIPGLRTTGSCGGHEKRHGKYWRCSQPAGRWFVSFRAPKAVLETLRAFAARVGVRFDKGPKDKLPLCGVCDSEGEKTWYAFWGEGDPRLIATKLRRYLAPAMAKAA